MVQATGSFGGASTHFLALTVSLVAAVGPLGAAVSSEGAEQAPNRTNTMNVTAILLKYCLCKESTPDHAQPDNRTEYQAEQNGG